MKITKHTPGHSDSPSGPQWHPMSYLDPARLWLPLQQLKANNNSQDPPIVKASVISNARRNGLEDIPPPAQVTVSKGRTQPPSGLWSGKVAGVSVREYGTVMPVGPDGSYMVYERLDYAEAKKRAPDAAAAMKRMRSFVSDFTASSSQEGEHGQAEDTTTVQKSSASLGGPAFTMGGRTKAVLPGLSLVAPGAETLPGPGQYDMPGNTLSGPAFSLRGRPRERLQEEQPGPGQYGNGMPNSTIGGGPAYTILGRAQHRVEDLPGPGEYDVARSASSGPAVTMVGRPRPRPVEVLPGPADYQQRNAPGRDAPAFTISTRPDPHPGPGPPAPGEYELPEAWRTGVAFTIAGRPQGRQPEDSPGPGQYFLKPVLGAEAGDGPAFTLAPRARDPSDPGFPGPGEYYRPIETSAPAFTIRGRPAPAKSELETGLQPGPGMYHVTSRPNSPSAPAYTFRGRPQEHSPGPVVPGPGAYQLPSRPEGPAYSIPASRPVEDKHPDSPGPGAYNTEAVQDMGPAFTMGTRPQERIADLPAPGDYEVSRESWRQGPAYTMRPALEGQQKASDSPGPGEYLLHSPSRGPAFTMAGLPVARDDKASQPGPGDYHVEPEDTGGPAFTIRGKTTERQSPPSPGPGDYHRKSAAGKDAPAYTIGSRVEQEAPASPVGPGFYNPEKPLPSAPAYTIRPKTAVAEEQLGADAPGPGAYTDVNLDGRGPAWTMGVPHHSPGGQEPGRDSPGPANYNLGSSLEGPAYTMRSRPKDAGAEHVPGPGEYSVPSTERGPAYTMRGKAKEPGSPLSPGPGDYHQARGNEAPAYTMAGRHQELQVLGDDIIIDPDIPGPIYGNPNVPGKDQIGLSGPAFTMRPRLAVKEDGAGPGPGDYATPGSPGGPAYTMRMRLPSSALQSEADVPGPGQYGSPGPATGQDAPAYTLRPQTKVPKSTNEEGPAPGDYGAPEAGPSGGPAFSLGAKLKELAKLKEKAMQPGPGEHHHMEAGPSGPAFSMGRRFKKKKGKAAGPEPGQYFQPLGPSGPSHSFQASPPRSSGKQSVDQPGPGDYEDARDLNSSPAWTLAPRPQPQRPPDIPGPGEYNDTQAFPRTLGSVVTSMMGQPRVEYVATSFGYADLYGRHGPSPGRAKRVTFEGSTRFRDSLEVPAGQTTGEDIRRLPDQAAAGGTRAHSAPRSRQQQQQAAGGKGNRAAAAVAAAAEKAAKLLARPTAEHSRLAQAQPQPRLSVQQARAAKVPAGVRFQTQLGVGGGVFTYAVPVGTTAGVPQSSRNLVSEYMGGARQGAQQGTQAKAGAGPGRAPLVLSSWNGGGSSNTKVAGAGGESGVRVTSVPLTMAQPHAVDRPAVVMARAHVGEASAVGKGARRALNYGGEVGMMAGSRNQGGDSKFGAANRMQVPGAAAGRVYAHGVSIV